MNRRTFLAASSAVLAVSKSAAEETQRLIDCHVSLGSHPFRRLGAENAAEFETVLRKRGVTEAWAGAFEGLLRQDVAAVNAELAEKCRGTFFRACGTLNPTLPAWQDDARRCAEVHGMRVIRLHPNYHDYTLEAPVFREVLALATELRLLVQIVIQMEDERTQHPRVRVPAVDLAPLSAIMKDSGAARVMLLNTNAPMVLRHLQDCPNVWLDFAMIEGVGGVGSLLKAWPQDRLVFGSFAPVFYWESAALKLRESALDAAQERAIQSENADALVG